MKYIWFICLLTCSFPAWAQNEAPATLSWGQELREPNNTAISKVIPFGDQLFAVRRRKGSGFSNSGVEKVILERYDENMKIKKSNEISLKYKGKKLSYENVIVLGRQFYLLSSFHNRAKKKNYLFIQTIDKRNLKTDSKYFKIAEIDTRSKMREGFFDYHISRDSSKIVIYNKIPTKKGKPERFAIQVFDDQFSPLWDKKITLPYDDDKFAVEEYQVDEQGNVYLLGVIYQDKSRTRRKGKPTYEYTILAYTNQGQDKESYRIKFTDKFITDLTFRVADDGNLVCSGFYSDKGTYSIKGTYFFRLNAKTKEVYNKNLKSFDFDFLTEHLSDRKKAKLKKAESSGNTRKQAELFSYDLDRLVLRNDGGALLIAEQYFVQEDYRYDYYLRTYQTDYYYNYNDIIIVNIRPDGEIEWTARIPKNQETRNDGGYFSSYAMSIVSDRLYFVYNDNPKNFKADKREGRIYNFNGSRSIIALAEVNRSGVVDTYPLFSNRDAEIITRPKICKQIGRRKMVIYGERGQRYRFGNLTF